MKRKDVIILHGWNLSGSRFLPLVTELTRLGYRVFAPDLPGFGKEAPPERPWHVVDYAEFLKSYIDHHHIKNPVLIGHSFGGRVALKFSHLYPHDSSALVLTGTPGFSPVPTKKLLLFFIISKIGGILFALPVLSLLADRARRFLYYVAGAREFVVARGAMRQTFKYIVQDDLTQAMQSVDVPCLLLWGEFDVIVPPVIATRMHQSIPNASLKVISEADHGVPFKQPALFASFVTKFLKRFE